MKFDQDFHRTFHKHNGIGHEVWVGGTGPPVILMHELDGFTRPCIRLAERLADRFRVYAPRFFGRVRQPAGNWSAVQGMWHICVHSEFVALRKGTTSRVAEWVRALARHARDRSPAGQKVGVVGMCLTGGIVLASLVEDAVAAGVAAQPSLPLPIKYLSSPGTRSDLGMSSTDVDAAAKSGTPLLTLRFENDRICPSERIAAIGQRIPRCTGPPEFLDGSHDHPTLTAAWRRRTSESDRVKSRQAIEKTMEFLEQHLGRDDSPVP